jgi:hypothetical protein
LRAVHTGRRAMVDLEHLARLQGQGRVASADAKCRC